MVPLASFETPLKARLRKLKESKEALNPPFWVRCRRWKSVLRRATTRSRSCQRLVVGAPSGGGTRVRGGSS
ncbi:hypothetical protein ES332_A10G121500v1 [Gossypium tomentosum]|uniref:Uncharacterized protein n=1 Tax=Gossypium tomentosum TaxID=34277 RepID=A0A5D2NP32_GOSTO|nr:hypothetical protein ES332_A10G121500v1 [Gossypium tomentosum]